MWATRHRVALTTDGDGAATGYTPVVTGRVLSVTYVKTDFADGVDLTLTANATGQAIVTLSNQNTATTVYPRVPVQDETGADALFAAGGTKLREPVTLASDKVKIVVAQGGATKTGAVIVVIG